MSYCLPEASYARVRHQQEKSRGHLGFSLPVLEPIAAGESRRGPLVQSVQKALAVVVDQEMHPKGICFLVRI